MGAPCTNHRDIRQPGNRARWRGVAPVIACPLPRPASAPPAGEPFAATQHDATPEAGRPRRENRMGDLQALTDRVAINRLYRMSLSATALRYDDRDPCFAHDLREAA